ncbi:hypothetical protein GmHk_03G007292 [Glycine max]|nr:hypothetical protein GmHk_03G007292 [Glycine max]
MTSRKRKSIGSRPTTKYDTRRFSSLDAWNWYTDNVLGRNILLERKVELYHIELDDFKTKLVRRNFYKRLTNLVDGSIDLALVKEFYANLYSSEGPSPKQSRVRGHLVKIDADSLNTLLETPVVLAEGETLPTYSRYCRLPMDYKEIEATLCIPGRGFILNTEGHHGKILRKDLTTLAQVVEPPGSIPSVEQFREMVAWPGTQPSLRREGEEEGETHVRQVAAATPERSLEATSEPPAPVVDLPSPQRTADPSTPILKILEDPTTPVLAMDTSPPATPVLHLTDEEDVQTQDTQDQSQEF